MDVGRLFYTRVQLTAKDRSANVVLVWSIGGSMAGVEVRGPRSSAEGASRVEAPKAPKG